MLVLLSPRQHVERRMSLRRQNLDSFPRMAAFSFPSATVDHSVVPVVAIIPNALPLMDRLLGMGIINLNHRNAGEFSGDVDSRTHRGAKGENCIAASGVWRPAHTDRGA